MSTEPKLDITDFTFDDVIPLRPALIKRMNGDIEGAAILARMQYRCRAQRPQDDGFRWWKSSLEELAEEIGWDVQKMKRKIKALLAQGWILSKIENESSWDRTRSYRPNDNSQPEVSAGQLQGSDLIPCKGSKVNLARGQNRPFEEVKTEPSKGSKLNLLPSSKEVEEEKKKEHAAPERREDVELICAHFNKSLEARGCKTKRVSETWRRDVRLMIDTDELTSKQIMDCIDWLTDHEFWSGVILSPNKLRAKYEQLRIQATAERNGGRNRKHRAYQDPDHAAYFEEL